MTDSKTRKSKEQNGETIVLSDTAMRHNTSVLSFTRTTVSVLVSSSRSLTGFRAMSSELRNDGLDNCDARWWSGPSALDRPFSELEDTGGSQLNVPAKRMHFPLLKLSSHSTNTRENFSNMRFFYFMWISEWLLGRYPGSDITLRLSLLFRHGAHFVGDASHQEP